MNLFGMPVEIDPSLPPDEMRIREPNGREVRLVAMIDGGPDHNAKRALIAKLSAELIGSEATIVLTDPNDVPPDPEASLSLIERFAEIERLGDIRPVDVPIMSPEALLFGEAPNRAQRRALGSKRYFPKGRKEDWE